VCTPCALHVIVQSMLTIFRMHLKKCKHKNKGREHRHCNCPIAVEEFMRRLCARVSQGSELGSGAKVVEATPLFCIARFSFPSSGVIFLIEGGDDL